MSHAEKVIERCWQLAKISDDAEGTFRTFLSPAMRRCYETVGAWMESAGMQVTVDNAGNLRGSYAGDGRCARPLLLGSHLDTVKNAGAFDGILGVVVAIELVESLGARKIPFGVEVVGFSEEEGVRFGTPFIGSHALAGTLSEDLLNKTDQDAIAVAQAIRSFGLDDSKASLGAMIPRPLAFLEFHIEQGPVLDHANESLAIVDAIVGLTRASVTFTGHANHAGTTPLSLRHDALCGAAEWVSAVEQTAASGAGLVATVGKLDVRPGVANAVPGEAIMTLDCRHADDGQRHAAVHELRSLAGRIVARRGLTMRWSELLDQPATQMDARLVEALDSVAGQRGFHLRRMASGAGHDAMIMAPHMPTAMLFLRSPGGISHHPDESVLLADVENALVLGDGFIQHLGESYKQWEIS